MSDSGKTADGDGGAGTGTGESAGESAGDSAGGEALWKRFWFRNGKVWAEVHPDGRPRDNEGMVRITYKKGDNRAYTTIADRLKAVDSSPPEAGPTAPPLADRKDGKGAGASKSRKPGKARTKKSAGRVGKALSSDSSVLGGTAADLEDPTAIHIWSDGACTGNPGPAGAGTVLLHGELRKEMSTWLGEGTNNIAELVGILQGLQELKRPVTRKIVLHTDSQYCIGVLARGWKAKANAELIQSIRKELDDLSNVVWHWVRGHEGVELNERCDELARDAITRRSSTSEVVA